MGRPRAAALTSFAAGSLIFVAVGVLALPVGVSGLVSANVLAGEPWLDDRAVDTHQLAGIITVILLVAVAGFALAALFGLRKTPTVSRAMTRAIVGLAAIGLTAALGTAYLGGTLRHGELHGTTSQTDPSTEPPGWIVTAVVAPDAVTRPCECTGCVCCADARRCTVPVGAIPGHVEGVEPVDRFQCSRYLRSESSR
jgi:hypothetical protein